MIPDNESVKNHIYKYHKFKINIGRLMNKLWSDMERQMRNFWIHSMTIGIILERILLKVNPKGGQYESYIFCDYFSKKYILLL